MSFRKQQLNSLIRNELATFIQREIEFPIGSLVTLIEVQVAPDFETGIAMVSVLPSDKKDEALAILKSNRALAQTFLFKRLKMAKVPQIRFEYDGGSEKSAAIEKILLNE